MCIIDQLDMQTSILTSSLNCYQPPPFIVTGCRYLEHFPFLSLKKGQKVEIQGYIQDNDLQLIF
jgi:hypothetical protein